MCAKKLPTVLVVDDDAVIRTMIRLLLEDEGYRILEAADDQAVTLARTEQPGVILLDIRMPRMDGVVMSRLLRAQAATAHIPIVCLGAELASGIRDGMIADEWLEKPFSADHLLSVVARWMKTSPLNHHASRPNPARQTP